MKITKKTCLLWSFLIVVSLVFSGCTTYSGFFDRLWERLGFNPRQQERAPGPGNREEKPEEDPNENGEIIEDVPNILSDVEQKVFEKINEYRVSKGLNTLAVDERLVEKAREHSRNMASGKVPFSHEGFQDRIQAAGIPYRSAAENVAYNSNHPDPADSAVEGWIASEGHRRNIEGNFDLTGVGVVKNEKGYYYFTQLFLLGR